MTYVLSHLVLLVLMALAVWLPGWVLERALLPVDHRPLRQLARVCLGLGFWTAAAFLLAASGQLHRPGAVAVLALVLGAAALTAIKGRQGSFALPRLSARATLAGALLGTVLAALVGGLFLLAISPPVSWDAEVYHLTLPRLYLEAHGFRQVEMSVYSNWPLGTEMLFALAMLAHGYTLAKLVHFFFGLLLLWAVALACRELGRRHAALLAMAFLLANPVVLFELRVAYVDLAHAFYFLAACLFMARALENGGLRTSARSWLTLAGLSAGLLAGTKITGLASAAIVGALALPTWWRTTRKGDARTATSALLGRFALPVALLTLPWLLKAAWFTGNPVYPLLFGGPDWSPELGERFTAWQKSIGMGRGLLDYLLLPLRAVVAGGRGYDRFDGELGLHWLVLVPLAAFFGRGRLQRLLLAAAGLSFVLWAFGSQQMRFLIPTLPLLAAAAAVAIVELGERFLGARWRTLGYPALCLLAAVPLVFYASGPARSGFRTLERYTASSPQEVRASVVHPIYRRIDEQLPAEARLLLLNTNRGFFLKREYLADSFFEASQIADWLRGSASPAEVRQRLAQRRVSHILVERRQRGIDFPPALLQLLGMPELAKPLWRSGDGRYDLFELLSEEAS